MATKAKRYALYGLAAAAPALAAALLTLALYAASQYDGKCGPGIIFGSGRYECTLPEFVREATFLVSFVVLVYGWWALLVAPALPPHVGFLVGRRKRRGEGTASTL